MWSTFIPTAMAAAIIVSVVSLASEIKNVRTARQGLGTEATIQRDASAWNEMQGSLGTGGQQLKTLEPGA
jgi:hypothetical protein